MLQPSTSIGSCDCSAWPSERGSTPCHLVGHSAQGQKLLFPLWPSCAPQLCSATPGRAPGRESALLGMKGGMLQPAKSSPFDSEAADSSPALYRTLSMHASQNSYVGNCETAFLQKKAW